MYIKELADQYPSICYECSNCRNPASESLKILGYTGCIIGINILHDDKFKNIKAEEVARGSVSINSIIFKNTNGKVLDHQLITRKTLECEYYENINSL